MTIISNLPLRSPFVRRLRFVAGGLVIAFFAAWIVSFAPFDDLLDSQGGPLGGDFVMFYLGGEIVAEGDISRLYELSEHQQRLRAMFPQVQNDLLPYRYPPFVATLTAPLAALPFAGSWLIFAAGSLTAGFLGWRCLLQLAPPRGEVSRTILFALACSPLAMEVILGGQASLFAFALAAGSLWLMSRQQFLAAGILLGLACYKPNVLAIYVVGCVLKHPRVLWGIVPTVLGLAVVSWLTVGFDGCWTYATLGQNLLKQPWDVPTPYWKVHGLAAWFDLISPGQGKLCALAMGGVLLGWWQWQNIRRPAFAGDSRWRMEMASLLTLNSLCNPYPPLYDLVLLTIPLYFHAVRLEKFIPRREFWFSGIAAIVLLGPHLSQQLSYGLQVQLFTVPLLAFMLWQLRGRNLAPERQTALAIPRHRLVEEPAGHTDNKTATAGHTS